MTTEAGFLQKILAEPDDDFHRLVFADWLEEHGDAEDQLRAEFIRAQIALAKHELAKKLPPLEFFPAGGLLFSKREALARRERELLLAHGQDWLLPLAEAIGIPTTPGHHKGNRYRYLGTKCAQWGEGGPEIQWEHRRGFVESVALSAASWLQHADALTAAAPIREVTLTTVPQRSEMMRYVAVHSSDDVAARWERGFGNEFLWDNVAAWNHLRGMEWDRITFRLPGQP